MEIQPIVIGTAGHIDHGKSSLVKALTQVDPDRLKEERERGLTIDLGFAPLELPDGRTVGIVDVPGHERFIRNMVAGATGMDLVVLVVAADDGVMPQTREHLQIMSLLGMSEGLIALNKIDMVDPELVELAAEDVREAVVGTFLEGKPILPVSAVTGAGLDEFREALFSAAGGIEPRSTTGVYRMPIQRVFTAPGFGTVLTGIPVTGEIHVGDTLEVLPGGQRSKVRGIHAYGSAVERARAGHSSALNMPDVDHHEVHRGNVVCAPNYFSAVRMVGARLQILPELERAVENRTSIRFHTGTADPQGELVLLDADRLEPGAAGLAQLRLSEPVVCAPGDRFIVRLASPAITLGGGVVLEESRYRLKRFKGFVLEELGRQEESLDSPTSLLESVLSRTGLQVQTSGDLAKAIKRDVGETSRFLGDLKSQQRIVCLGGAAGSPQAKWIHRDRMEEALGRLRREVEGWFAENPHRTVMEVLELRRLTEMEPAFLSALLEQEKERGYLELESGGRLRLAGRKLDLDPETVERRAKILATLESAGFQPPGAEELAAAAGLAAGEAQALFELLVDEGTIERIQKDYYLASSSLELAREGIVENCGRNGHLEIPELRDRLGTSRKFLIPLLEYFDVQGLTIRQGGHRVLKNRG